MSTTSAENILESEFSRGNMMFVCGSEIPMTMLELIQAVSETLEARGITDDRVIARITRGLIDDGTVRLSGTFRDGLDS